MAGSARACRARPPPYNLLLTVQGIVLHSSNRRRHFQYAVRSTLQFVRLRASRMALACARRRAPEKHPGPVDELPLVSCYVGPSRSLRPSGRSARRKRGNGRVTAPTAAGGSMVSRHRRHGLPSSRLRSRALHGSRHPQPRDQSLLHSSNKRRHFSTQYAVRGVPLAQLAGSGHLGALSTFAFSPGYSFTS